MGKEANTLAACRGKYYGHIAEGWDTTLIAKGLAACNSETRGALKSLMTGDTYTDNTAHNFGKGTGHCKICGAVDAKIWHTLWECLGPNLE